MSDEDSKFRKTLKELADLAGKFIKGAAREKKLKEEKDNREKRKNPTSSGGWAIVCPHCPDGYCKQIEDKSPDAFFKYRIICSCGKIDTPAFTASDEILNAFGERNKELERLKKEGEKDINMDV